MQRHKYIYQMQQVANRQAQKIEISLDDLISFFSSNPGLVDRIKHNTK
jgi:hypothetical protein